MPDRCETGKIGYSDRQAAHRALHSTGRHRRGERRVYECPVCHRWHLTSQPEPDPEDRAERKRSRRRR